MEKIIVLVLLLANSIRGDTVESNECDFSPGWKPIIYSLDIVTFIHKPEEENFYGKVKITGLTTKRTNELMLHSRVNITEAFYNVKGKLTKLPLDCITENDTIGYLTIELTETLLEDEEILLIFSFFGKLRNSQGLFHAFYDVSNKKPLISLELQPIYAKYVFPCIDLPNQKAIFELRIARPQDMISISNVQLKETSSPDPEIDNQVWDVYFPSPKMSPYNLAFVIADYVNVKVTANSSFWIPKDSVGDVTYALVVVPQFVKAMEEYTDLNYTLSKLDHVTVPDLLGYAVENWGLIIWRQEDFLLKKGKSTIVDELKLITFISHEIAHQWYGNLVTCDSWNYVWLNEAVASYLMMLLTDTVFPKTKRLDLLTIHDLQDMLYSDAYVPKHITFPYICNEGEIKKVFNPTTYYKGAGILHMVDKMIAGEAFRSGMISIVKNNAYGTIKESDFWESIAKHMDQNILPENETLDSVMSPWFQNNGFPYLTVMRVNDSEIALSQEQFRVRKVPKDDHFWWIPLTYTTSKEKNFHNHALKEWLKPRNGIQKINLKLGSDDWVIFNIRQKGIYRVNYDLRTWELLVSFLRNDKFNEIHPLNRAQLIDDAFTFAISRLLNYSTALDLSLYLKRETHYYPWRTILLYFESINAYTEGHHLGDKLKVYMKYVMVNIYSHVVSKEFKLDSPINRLLQYQIVEFFCLLGVEVCVNQSLETINFIMENPTEEYRLNNDLRSVFWCLAAKHGGTDVWEFIKNKFISTEYRKDKYIYFQAMERCSNPIGSLKSFLKDIFEGADYLKDEDFYDIINEVLTSNGGDASCTIIEFFAENYSWFVDKHGVGILTQYLDLLSNTMWDNPCRSELKSFLKKNSLEMTVREDNAWMTAFGDEVNNWFENNFGNLSSIQESLDAEFSKIISVDIFMDHGQSDFYKTFDIPKPHFTKKNLE